MEKVHEFRNIRTIPWARVDAWLHGHGSTREGDATQGWIQAPCGAEYRYSVDEPHAVAVLTHVNWSDASSEFVHRSLMKDLTRLLSSPTATNVPGYWYEGQCTIENSTDCVLHYVGDAGTDIDLMSHTVEIASHSPVVTAFIIDSTTADPITVRYRVSSTSQPDATLEITYTLGGTNVHTATAQLTPQGRITVEVDGSRPVETHKQGGCGDYYAWPFKLTLRD